MELGWININWLETTAEGSLEEHQGCDKSEDNFQMILGFFLNFFMSKSCISTFELLRALVSFWSSCFFHKFKAEIEAEPNSNFDWNDCSETGKRQNSCDDKFSAEDTYVEAQWWVIIKDYRPGSANAVRPAVSTALLSQICAVIGTITVIFTQYWNITSPQWCRFSRQFMK